MHKIYTSDVSYLQEARQIEEQQENGILFVTLFIQGRHVLPL
jgi:hypothetical protein